MKAAHIFVTGFVQGVGYRQFVKSEARKRGLTGWVRNLPDSRVEALFIGEKKELEKMIQLCKKGPFLSEVENIAVFWEDKKETFEDFTITS